MTASSSEPPATPRPNPVAARRELGIAVAGCVLAAALVLIAGGRTWVRFSVSLAPLPAVRGAATGHQVAATITSLGLVVLAAAVALVATRRMGRQLTGALIVAVGAVTVVQSLTVSADPTGAVRDQVASATGRVGIASSAVSAAVNGWPWVTGVGGLIAVAVGVLTAIRGRRWPAMGRRYDAATQRGQASLAGATAGRPPDETSMWDALDRGDDPTA
jgi:uncharacterized membrane protein (TIGR02234 family)